MKPINCSIGCLILIASLGCRQQPKGMTEPPVAASDSKDTPSRAFVREWTLADLRRELRYVGQGRLYENGKRMFSVARCDQCHRLNQIGGDYGPDLTGVAGRSSRATILREILEPSKQILQQYQTHLIVADSGLTHQGLVRGQDAEFLHLANNPDKPTEVLKIPLDEIEEKKPLDISTMPRGLLNTLTKEEILDLLAYIEAGGREGHRVYDGVGE